MTLDFEAIGKLLGMVMAYGVSSLGLLLAYLNYRRRVVKAEKAFSPLALGLTLSIGTVLLAALGFAVFVLTKLPPEIEKKLFIGHAGALQGSFLSEIGIPLGILIFSFIITWLLYRRFAGRHHAEHAHQPSPPTA